MLTFHLTPKSSNAKTGPIPVSTSSRELCPVTCPFREKGCYAKGGPLAIHWAAVTAGNRGDTWPVFLEKIAALPTAQLWRHNQAGDLYDPNSLVGQTALRALADANTGKRGFTYTHHHLVGAGAAAAIAATAAGFTVNQSTESLTAADAAVAAGLHAVVVVRSDETRATFRTPAGNRVAVCPAQRRDGVTCATCGLCQSRDQSLVIAFKAHGSARRTVDAIVDAVEA